ncbi:MAG: ornithine cyclodeaminase family protein [Thermodesulfobacteriota bacterium]
MKLKVFQAADLTAVLSMNEAIAVVKDAFAQLASKIALAPLRTSIPLKNPGEVALLMPAYLPKTRALGAKMVTVFPQNPLQGLPAVQALVFLFDSATGSPLAILEGTELTRFRTGAATGCATQILSRADAQTLAIFGAGGQAWYQIMAVCSVRQIKRILIYDLLKEKVDALISNLQKTSWAKDIEIKKAPSPETAVSQADIIVTATTSSRPVFSGQKLNPGTHINAIGSFRPDMQEVDEETISRAKIFVDSLSACLEEAGDIIIPLQKGVINKSAIQAELGELALGLKPGRLNNQEITYFKSVGNAVQDVSVALAIWQKAEEKGRGQEIEI